MAQAYRNSLRAEFLTGLSEKRLSLLAKSLMRKSDMYLLLYPVHEG